MSNSQSERISLHLNLMATFIMCHGMIKFCRDVLIQQKKLKRTKEDEQKVNAVLATCSWPPADLLGLEEVRRLKEFSHIRESVKAMHRDGDELETGTTEWEQAKILTTALFAVACHDTQNMQGLVQPLDSKSERLVLQELDNQMQELVALWLMRREVMRERKRLNLSPSFVSLDDINLWKETKTVQSR